MSALRKLRESTGAQIIFYFWLVLRSVFPHGLTHAINPSQKWPEVHIPSDCRFSRLTIDTSPHVGGSQEFMGATAAGQVGDEDDLGVSSTVSVGRRS